MKIKNILSFIVLVLSICSCTKNFEEINTDPNRPKTITPGVMLSQLQYRIVSASIVEARNFTHQLMQVDAPRSSPGGSGLHRYVVNPGSGVWSSFYNYLTDIDDIYNISNKTGENNYKAIALVYKTWAFSILTDLYGDVPFSQSNKALDGILKPKFDKQKDIYVQLLANLDSANNLFNTTKPLTYGGDVLYSANTMSGNTNEGIVKWKKFTNSLKLRLLIRLSKKNGELNIDEQIATILSNPSKYPVFTSNADEAIFKFTGVQPYYNPYYNARQLEWRDGTYFTKFFLNKLNADNDPRRTIWARTVTVNGSPVYQGIESGYPSNVEYQVGANSSYNDAMRTMQQLGVMMTYAEVEFIKAELSLKGFTTGKTPRQHYESGIIASMNQWGAVMPAGFLLQAGVKYDEGAGVDAQLQSIMMQKYIAYFFVDYQAWFEKRRSGYPILPRGSGIPAENKFPYRIPYPTYLQSLNSENLANAVASMGGDDSNTKVWWDK